MILLFGFVIYMLLFFIGEIDTNVHEVHMGLWLFYRIPFVIFFRYHPMNSGKEIGFLLSCLVFYCAANNGRVSVFRMRLACPVFEFTFCLLPWSCDIVQVGCNFVRVAVFGCSKYLFLLPFLVEIVQGNCVLRLPLHLRLLLSPRSCVLDVVSVLRFVNQIWFPLHVSFLLYLQLMNLIINLICLFRNAHLKQSRSSTCQKIWIKIQLIDMAPTLSNYTG